MLWFQIRKNKLGLISKETSELSNVTPEEADAFVDPKSEK
jgi:hypothetical protein